MPYISSFGMIIADSLLYGYPYTVLGAHTHNRLSRRLEMKKMKLISITIFMLLVSTAVFADEISAAQNAVAIDTVWTLIAAVLVFFMQAGFAMVEVGFTRAKNASNILMKNLMHMNKSKL